MIYSKPPVVRIENEHTVKAGVSLHLVREDLNHPKVSGNKWWKLKYNLEEARYQEQGTLLTFGGAYSNHIYATASAAHEEKFESIGVIRGEETFPLNATLSFAKRQGMRLNYVSRETYKKKGTKELEKELRKRFGNFYMIPEGGTNILAIKGVEEWGQLLRNEIDFDYLCLPVGTGGTLAGMVNVLNEKKIIGFSSLKGGTFLYDEVKKWSSKSFDNCTIETKYHFGGYAKVTKELIEFINSFEKQYEIPLDPVYTGKMIYGVFNLLYQKKFEPGSKVLLLHTGGLQGRVGFNF